MSRTAHITLLTSLDPLLRESVLARLRVDRPDLTVLRHDLDLLDTEGVVVRRIITGTQVIEERLALSDGCCLTCLVREDVLDVARSGVAEHLVAVVPAALDPLPFAMLLAHAGQHDDHDTGHHGGHACSALGPLVAYVAIVRAATLEQALRDDAPPEPVSVEGVRAGLSVSELVLRQVEHADIVLHDRTDTRSAMLLASLADSATHLQLDVDPVAWTTPSRTDAGWTPGGLRPRKHMTPTSSGGIAHVRWHRRRPLHPKRLAEAIDHGALGGALRARGFAWVASRPDAVLEISIAAESFALGAIDTWLEPLSDDLDVPDAPPCPSVDLGGSHVEWHPYYGDRFQQLSIICESGELQDLLDELERCLLTDQELSEGPTAWRLIDDPLVGSDEQGPEIIS